jgi:hypothetical protein
MEKKLFRRGGMPVDASHGYATLWSQSGFFSPTAHGTFCAKPAGGSGEQNIGEQRASGIAHDEKSWKSCAAQTTCGEVSSKRNRPGRKQVGNETLHRNVRKSMNER